MRYQMCVNYYDECLYEIKWVPMTNLFKLQLNYEYATNDRRKYENM